MKNLSGYLSMVCLLAGSLLTSSQALAQYSIPKPTSRDFAAERKAPPPPPEATALSTDDLKAVAPITFDELRTFAGDWRKYARWLKTDGNEYKAVAYLGVSNAADYPPEVVKWMDEHGWAADRFFLLERKFRVTLSVLEQEAKQKNLLNHLEAQIQQVEDNQSLSDEDKKARKNQFLTTLRSVRAATSTKAPVTPDEYELIKMNHEALTKLLAE